MVLYSDFFFILFDASRNPTETLLTKVQALMKLYRLLKFLFIPALREM